MHRDKIILKGLKFFGYHGVLQEEQTQGQYFTIDLELFLNLSQAGKTDDLNETIDYSVVFEFIKNTVEQKRFKLIEALGEYIAQKLLTDFPQLQALEITVKKPQAPLDGTFEYSGITLYREQL